MSSHSNPFSEFLLTLRAKHPDWLLGAISGIAYGLFVRSVFNYDKYLESLVGKSFIDSIGVPILYVMSISFLFFTPFAMGWLSVAIAEKIRRRSIWLWFVLPFISISIALALSVVFAWEGYICIVFAFPCMFVMGILGGISGGIYTRRRKKSSNAITMCVALLPLLVMSLENRFTPSPEIRTVETSIDIHASADTVWSNIERVPLIQPHELGFSWARSIGFPRPLEATLSHEGVGGIRHATFEHGVLFIETVDEWIPNQRLGFHIRADTANIPPKTFDEHVRIGGRYFDVLYGEYSLEPLPNGVIRLHLISRQRLSTDFDAYAGIWTDGVMRDLQQSILSVIQHRCERN